MVVMALVGLFTVVFPLGLGLVFWRKFGGRWRFFLLGCVVFPLFALTLEGSVNRAVLYGPMGALSRETCGCTPCSAGLWPESLRSAVAGPPSA